MTFTSSSYSDSMDSDDSYSTADTDASGDSEYEMFDETEDKAAEDDKISERFARRMERMLADSGIGINKF